MAVVLAIVVITGLVISGYKNGLSNNLADLERKLASTKTRIEEAKTEEQDREQAIKLSELYIVSGDLNQDKYNKILAKMFLAKMRQRYGLSDIQISIDNFSTVDAGENSYGIQVKSTSAQVKFASSYDLPLYDFFAALEDSLPGVVVITGINLSKKMDVSSITFKTEPLKGSKEVVSGDLSFEWFAIVDTLDKSRISAEQVISEYEKKIGMEEIEEESEGDFEQNIFDGPLVGSDVNVEQLDIPALPLDNPSIEEDTGQ